jgi:predicted anti-sigma-YlaC factor YlaD
MECQIYRLLIDEMDFDSLIDDLKPYVLKHMNTCEQCAAYYKDINKVDAMISEFANVGTPAAELDIAMPPRESNSVAVFFSPYWHVLETYISPMGRRGCLRNARGYWSSVPLVLP